MNIRDMDITFATNTWLGGGEVMVNPFHETDQFPVFDGFDVERGYVKGYVNALPGDKRLVFDFGRLGNVEPYSQSTDKIVFKQIIEPLV
jgi:hypothetical protein